MRKREGTRAGQAVGRREGTGAGADSGKKRGDRKRVNIEKWGDWKRGG